MSNYWKKPEQHKKLDYIENRTIVKPYGDLPFVQAYHIYEGRITPDTMIKSHKAYSIDYLDPLFILNGFIVITENNLVLNILLMGIHPNRNPETHMYCLPEYRIKKEFTPEYFEKVLKTIKTYYLDDCYFQPEKKYVRYKPLKSMSIQLNQEE